MSIIKTSAEIQADIDSKNAAIDQEVAMGQQANNDQINLWRMDLTTLQAELATAKAQEQAQQERTQAQEVAVESITLPYDFNAILSDENFKDAEGQPHVITIANGMIIEVIKDFQRQSNTEHNAEVEKISAEWADKLRAAADREVQLQRQNKELQDALNVAHHANQDLNQNYIALEQHTVQLQLDKQDAEAKRNAAVTEKEGIELLLSEKQEQIDQLRKDLQNAPAPKSAIDISPTATLAQMVKDTAEAKAARALARWNTSNPDLAVKNIDLPSLVLPTVDTQNHGQDTAASHEVNPPINFQPAETELQHTEDHSGATGLASVGQSGESQAAEPEVITLESLKAEVDAIKAHIGLAAA